MPTIKGFLWRGLAAGGAGGLAAGLFILALTETQIDRAIAFENAAGLGLEGQAAMFARSTQRWGALAATLVYGAALGLVLAVVVAALHHRLPGRDSFGRTIRVATAAFVATMVVPGLKYPPNPPAVGDPDTIGSRTTNYLVLLGLSVLVTYAAFVVWGEMTARGRVGSTRFGAVAGGYVVAVAVLWLAFPSGPDALVPPDNEAAPALVVSADAPPVVLDALLASALARGDESIRDPKDPSAPLDLTMVTSGTELRGMPMALSTTDLAAHGYTDMVWSFRVRSFAGVGLLWLVTGGVLGYLLDRQRTVRPGKSPSSRHRSRYPA